MPYYLYRIVERPIRRVEKIAEFGAFKEASAEAKRLRQAGAVAAGEQVKTIFADNELMAEDLLGQVRAAPLVPGDD